MGRELTEEEWIRLFDTSPDEWLYELYKHGYRVIKLSEHK